MKRGRDGCFGSLYPKCVFQLFQLVAELKLRGESEVCMCFELVTVNCWGVVEVGVVGGMKSAPEYLPTISAW